MNVVLQIKKKKRKSVASRKTNCRLLHLWRANVLNGAKENYIIEWTISSVNPVHGGISFLLPVWDGICYGFISARNTPGGDIFSQQSWLFWIYGTNRGVAESGIYMFLLHYTNFFSFFAPVRWQVLGVIFVALLADEKSLATNLQMLNE